MLSVQLAVALAAKPAAGRLSDRIGRKPVIAAGLAICALALPLIFRADSLLLLLAVVPLLGLGIGAVVPVTNALIADLAAAERVGAAMGVFGTIWDVGEALGPILAGILIARYGFAAGFDVIAAVTAAAAVGLAILIVDPVRKRTGRG